MSGKTDSPMSLLSCSGFSGWIPIWSMDAISRNPSYSASFSPLIFLLHYPFLISLYLWLNMYFSKDADSVPPTFESPWIHRGWTSVWRWWNSSWAISNPERWCCESAALNMPAHLENSAVATGLEKVSFHSNSKERQCQRMLKLSHNYTHLTC